MRKEIIILVSGILIGAIISSTIFMITKPNDKREMHNFDNNQVGNFSKFDNRKRSNRPNGNHRRIENSTINDDFN